jgi:hypothetical protein
LSIVVHGVTLSQHFAGGHNFHGNEYVPRKYAKPEVIVKIAELTALPTFGLESKKKKSKVVGGLNNYFSLDLKLKVQSSST